MDPDNDSNFAASSDDGVTAYSDQELLEAARRSEVPPRRASRGKETGRGGLALSPVARSKSLARHRVSWRAGFD
ncbi:hypothetical protein A5680_07630 [Mycobacterium sp. E2989]|nr:hypothetical protein A5680_07630 [Mycobacterium sp. E2989]